MKQKKRLYELTVVISGKNGKPPVTKKIKYKDIDSVHASIAVMKLFGRKRNAKVTSAVLVKENDE